MEKEKVERVLKGNATKHEAREVVEWFSGTPEGQTQLSELINESILTIGSDDLTSHSPTPLQSNEIYEQILIRIRRRTFRRNIMRVAAILTPLILVAGLTFYTNSMVNLFGKTEYTEIYVPKSQIQHIIFQDGSEAIVNSDSKIRFPKKFGLRDRTVSMQGEAYFHITSNSKRPFFVNVDNTKVKVYGTSFNVKSYLDDKDINIVLDTGKVSFVACQNEFDLKPGHQLIFNKKTGKTTIIKLENSLNSSIWLENKLRFNDTALAEVIKILNRKFDVEFLVENPKLYKYTYTLTSGAASLEQLLKELEKITPVKFTLKQDNLIHVTTKN